MNGQDASVALASGPICCATGGPTRGRMSHTMQLPDRGTAMTKTTLMKNIPVGTRLKDNKTAAATIPFPVADDLQVAIQKAKSPS